MKRQLRKAMVERSIKKIEKELANLDSEREASFLQPIENAQETYIVKNKENRKARLEAELQRHKVILQDCEAKSDESS